MAEEIKRLWEDFRSGKISRRKFMRQAIMITGSLGAAERHHRRARAWRGDRLPGRRKRPGYFRPTMLATLVKPARSRLISLVR